MPAAAAVFCVVVAISAGDAMTVQCGELKEGVPPLRTVNLHAIAAPEDDQPFAEQSRMHLEFMCKSSPVQITLRGKGRDGDTVADVQCRHVDAATEQVRSGLAWHDHDYGHAHHHLKSAQAEAVKAGREIWSGAKPVPPWEWQKRRYAAAKKQATARARVAQSRAE